MFFRAKRPWSRYKDTILEYYLDPYIPKVATLKKPILVVDCFAGRGLFGDGEPGSPLIISPLGKKWRDKGVDVRAEFMVEVGAHSPGLAERAERNTVFLHVDPCEVQRRRPVRLHPEGSTGRRRPAKGGPARLTRRREADDPGATAAAGPHGSLLRVRTGEINAAIGELLKPGRLFGSNGKSRVNDAEVLGISVRLRDGDWSRDS